jgi:hypothetical protein
VGGFGRKCTAGRLDGRVRKRDSIVLYLAGHDRESSLSRGAPQKGGSMGRLFTSLCCTAIDRDLTLSQGAQFRSAAHGCDHRGRLLVC